MATSNNLPQHIAIIMDGNGRWAKAKGLSRTAGHKAGIENTKSIIKAASALGIKALSLFVFSSENWQRPQKEVGMLMYYLDNFLLRYINELNKNNIKLMVIGRDEPLAKSLQNKIKIAQDKTKDNTGLILILALNYGGRQDIVDAAKQFSREAKAGNTDIENMDVSGFSSYLSTRGLPDPDLLIRTSNEMRLSNFLLWQLSYAELYFSKKYWPDFQKDDLKKAIRAYTKRKRRFGKVS